MAPRFASQSRNYLAGLSSGYLLMFATVAVGLWLTPYSLRFLDREEYAIFILVNDVLMWLTLLDLGITSSLRLQAAQLTGCPDQERLNRLASTAFFAQNGIVLAALLAGLGLAFGVPHFFPVRPDLQLTTTWVMALLVLGTAMSLGTQTFSALLVANQQMHIDNALGLLHLVTRTVLTVWLLQVGWGLYSLAVANIAARGTSSLLAAVRTFRLLPQLRLRWSLASWDVFRSIIGIGLWFTLGGLSGILVSSLDRLVTAKLISVQLVTTLTLTGRLYALAHGIIDQITNNARPMLGQLIGQKKMRETASVYRHLFALSSGLALIAAASLWAANGAFIAQWVGAEHYGGWQMDLAFALYLVARAWTLPNRAALAAGLFRVPSHAISCMVEGLLGVILSILLGLRFGVLGIVFAVPLAAVLVTCWYLPRLTAQMFGQGLFQLIGQNLRSVALTALFVIPAAWGARILGNAVGGGFLGASVAGVCTGTVGAFLLWFAGFDQSLKRRMLAQLANVWTRLAGRRPTVQVGG